MNGALRKAKYIVKDSYILTGGKGWYVKDVQVSGEQILISVTDVSMNLNRPPREIVLKCYEDDLFDVSLKELDINNNK